MLGLGLWLVVEAALALRRTETTDDPLIHIDIESDELSGSAPAPLAGRKIRFSPAR